MNESQDSEWNPIKISSWERLHKAATNGTTVLLKSLGLTLASWNAIICNKSVHRAWLYNFEKPSQEIVDEVAWLNLLIKCHAILNLAFTLQTYCSLYGFFQSDYSFSHCHPLHVSLPPIFGSLTCANVGMVQHAAQVLPCLDWSSSSNEFLLLLLPVLQQASMDTSLEQPSM